MASQHDTYLTTVSVGHPDYAPDITRTNRHGIRTSHEVVVHRALVGTEAGGHFRQRWRLWRRWRWLLRRWWLWCGRGRLGRTGSTPAAARTADLLQLFHFDVERYGFLQLHVLREGDESVDTRRAPGMSERRQSEPTQAETTSAERKYQRGREHTQTQPMSGTTVTRLINTTVTV